MNSADGHGDLADGVHYGQVYDCSENTQTWPASQPWQHTLTDQRQSAETAFPLKVLDELWSVGNCTLKLYKKTLLELPKPGISNDGTQNGRQVAQSHKSMIDGGRKVIIPKQKIPEIQHQHS